MKNIYKLFWSEEALKNLQLLIIYFESRWTQKEIEKLYWAPYLMDECNYNNDKRNPVYIKYKKGKSNYIFIYEISEKGKYRNICP